MGTLGKHWKLSLRTKKKMSLSQMGNKHRLGQHWKLSKIHKQKISRALKGKYIGEKSWEWKGNKVSYSGLHKWVIKNLGNATHCKNCGLDKIPEGMKRYFQWANRSHKYLRDLKDWIPLCIKCHIKYDKKSKKPRSLQADNSKGYGTGRQQV